MNNHSSNVKQCISKPYWIETALIVPTPLEGKELYTQLGFFQTILTDRYINRREIRVVPLKSPTSVEYEITQIFLILFSRAIYGGFNFC